jgi:hypothetical protein
MLLMNKKLLSLGVSGLLAFGFVVVDYIPSLQKIFSLRQEMSARSRSFLSLSKEEKKNMSLRLEEDLARQNKDFTWARQAVTEMKSRIQQEDNVPAFLMQIEQMVSFAQLEMISLNPKEPILAPDKTYKLIPFEILLRGPFAQLMVFLESFEREKIVVFSREINIHKNESTFPKLECRMSFYVLSNPSSGIGSVAGDKKAP